MILLVTVLELALRVGVILVFPALAVRAWRAGGAARLWRVGAIAVAVILVAAVYVATPASGNALARTRGYGYTVPASLLLHGLTLCLPVVMTAAIVRLLAPRLSSGLALYGLGVLMAGLTWIAGIGLALSVFYR
ncbi:MAG TPA: hypothetical protein VF578_25025 [Methylomirabilota bacterium]